MSLGLTKSYTPSAGQVINSSSYNTDISALFNALSGLEAQTSTLGGLTITPSANSTTIFRINNAAGTELLSADTTNSFLKLKATSKLYLDGGGNTYISESSADNFVLYVGGVLVQGMSATQASFGIDTSVAATKKLFLDGGGDTYFIEQSANDVRCYVGGTLIQEWVATLSSYATDVSIAATKKLLLDGSASGNTYLIEQSADNLRMYVGGVLIQDVTATYCSFGKAIAVPATESVFLGGYGTANAALNTATLGTGSTTIYIGTNTINTTAPSDENLKENIRNNAGVLDRIKSLKVVDFKYKQDKISDNGKDHIGMLAQDVEKIFPEFVIERSDGFKQIHYHEMIPCLVKAIQELINRVEILEA